MNAQDHRQGGCLCGAVRFALQAGDLASLACHCADCRRYNGGAPAYERVFSKSAFALTQGAPQSYRKTADSGFATTRYFCGACGAPLYIELEQLPDIVVVPTGAIDDDDAFSVKAHIFAASAPAWHRFEPDADRFPREFPQND